LTTCAKEKTNERQQIPWPVLKSQIQTKFDVYLELAKDLSDADGWIEMEHESCDGLLFNSLFSAVGGSPDLYLAEDTNKPGKFFRNPNKNCYSNHKAGLSPSAGAECSRDGYHGLFLDILVSKDLDAIERIIKFGEKSLFFKMCEGEPGKVNWTPELVYLGYQLREHLGGDKPPIPRVKQALGDCTNFRCHLQALFAFIQASIVGGMEQRQLDQIKKSADASPRNAVINSIFANFSGNEAYARRVADVLLDESLFPADSLPTSANKKGYYIFQREESSARWRPKPEDGRQHYGIDFLFAAAIILDII